MRRDYGAAPRGERGGLFLARARALRPWRRVLPGEAEAELSSLAAIRSIGGADEGFVTIFDTGGGSTEFVFLRDGARLEALSVEAGAVTLTDEYFAKSPANPQTVCSVTASLIKKFTEAGVGREAGRVIGAGGNVTAMAAVAAGMAEYDRSKIHGSALTKAEVMRQVALYAQSTAEERRAIPGLSPKRADIILGGACIILAAMEAAKATKSPSATAACATSCCAASAPARARRSHKGRRAP